MAATCGSGYGIAYGLADLAPTPSGSVCATNSAAGLIGYCPTATAVSACNLAGFCVDSHACTTGCGPSAKNAAVSTTTCGSNQFCSIGVFPPPAGYGTVTYHYVACGAQETTTTVTAPNFAGGGGAPTSFSSSQSAASTSSAAATSSTANITVSQSTTQGNSSNAGAIAGGVVGGVALVCLTILALFWMRRRRRVKQNAGPPPYEQKPGELDDSATHELSGGAGLGLVKTPTWSTNARPAEMDAETGVVELPSKEKTLAELSDRPIAELPGHTVGAYGPTD